MRVNIEGNGIEITDKVRELVDDKLVKDIDKYLKTFAEDVKTAKVRIEERSRWGYKVSFDMWLPGKEHIYAEDKDENLQNAVVKVREHLERQIRKYKRKLSSRSKGTSKEDKYSLDTGEE